jgi:hypothetical protein
MIGHLDFQEHAVRPFSEDYLTVLKEYGIIPMSKITLQDIEKIIEEDHKILTAIYYLLQSNLDFVGMSYSNDNSFQNRILEIKLQIETTLNHL